MFLLLFISYLFSRSYSQEVGVCLYPSILNPEVEKIFKGVNACRFFTRHGMYSVPPINSRPFGELTPYWAQELSGLDLSKQFLEDYEKEAGLPELHGVSLGIIDEGVDLGNLPPEKIKSTYLKFCTNNPDDQQCDGLEDYPQHGTSVANLMIGTPPIGTTHRAKLSCAAALTPSKKQVAPKSSINSEEINALELLGLKKIDEAKMKCIEDQDQKADIINMSYGYPDYSFSGDRKKYLSSLQEISKKSILVIASGNDYPDKINETMKSLSGIRVGAIDPNGLHSSYSQSDDEVDICAPSAHEIQTKTTIKTADGEKTKKLASFSGTSAATPLVTAALANVSELLPGISREEARALLKKCAYKTAGYDGSANGNGAGALNSYKMMEVAKRLRAEIKPSWPKNRNSLFTDDLYDFTKSSEAHYLKAIKLIQKQTSKDKFSIDCDSQELIYNHLRKAVFLDSNNSQAANELAKLYQINGFESQAEYFTAKSPKDILKNELSRLIKKNAELKDFHALARSAARYGISPYDLGDKFVNKLCDGEGIMTTFERGNTIAKLAVDLPIQVVTKLFLDTVKKFKKDSDNADNFFNLIYDTNTNFEHLHQDKKSFELIDSLYDLSPENRLVLIKYFKEKMRSDELPEVKINFMTKIANTASPKVLAELYEGLSYYCRPKSAVEHFIKNYPPKDSKDLEGIKKCINKTAL